MKLARSILCARCLGTWLVLLLGMPTVAYAQQQTTGPTPTASVTLDPTARQRALELAYQREFAYLKAQKDALTKRLGELQGRDQRERREAREALERLQGRVLRLTLEADKLEGDLASAEREAQAVSDGEDIIATTLSQARTTLKPHGLIVTEPPAASGEGDARQEKPAAQLTRERAEALGDAFTQAVGLLDTLQRVRVSEGAFFLPDGVRVEGKIARVGNVAALGVSTRGAGALAPAGAGRLKLWRAPEDAPAPATAQALIAGEHPATVALFLFESLERDIEEKKEKTWDDLMRAGGVVGWVIVGLGLLGLLLVIARVVLLLIASVGAGALLARLSALVSTGELERAQAEAAAARGPLARVLNATLEGLRRSREEMEDCVAEALLQESPRLERFGSTIAVFAAVAPLLGLLGTVTGMISTFDVITEYGTGDPKMLSGGISEALITTQLGLIVAIPLLLLGNVTGALANSLLTRLERAALTIMNLASAPSALGDGADGDASASDDGLARGSDGGE